jgi:hypothetical protein
MRAEGPPASDAGRVLARPGARRLSLRRKDLAHAADAGLAPGQLTRRYIEGERARFVSPVALFLFSVFLMFAVFSSIGGPFAANSEVTVTQPGSETPKSAAPATAPAPAKAPRPTFDLSEIAKNRGWTWISGRSRSGGRTRR